MTIRVQLSRELAEVVYSALEAVYPELEQERLDPRVLGECKVLASSLRRQLTRSNPMVPVLEEQPWLPGM